MADGHIKISSKIDNSQAEKDFKELENLIKEYAGKNEKSLTAALKKSQNEYDRLNKKINSSTIEMELLGKSIDDLEKKKLNEELLGRGTGAKMVQDQIDEVFDKMDALADETAVWELGLIQVDASLEQIGNRLERAAHSQISVAEAAKQSAYQSELQAKGIAVATDDIVIGTRKWADVIDNKVNYGYTDTENKVRVLASVQKDNVVETEKLAGATNKVAIATGRAVKESKNLGKSTSLGVGKIGRYALALFSIRSIYGMLSKLSNQWLNSNDIAAQRTKAQIEQMSSMVSNMLAPAIQFLVNLMAQLLGYVNAVMKAFFGIDLASKKASKNTGGVAKGAKKANKEIQRMKAGFDEFETLTKDAEDNLDDIGGGAGGGIDDFVVPTPDTSLFEKAIDYLKEKMIDLWNTDTIQSFFHSFKTIGTEAFNAIRSIALNMWDNVVLSWDEASPFIFEGLDNLVEYWRRMFEDIAITVQKWLPQITEKINEFVDNVFDTFRPLTTFIAQLWRDFTQIMLDLWNEYGLPILDEVGRFIDGLIDTFNKIWTSVIDPIIKPAIEFLKKMWDEHIKDILYAIGDFIGTMILESLRFYNEFIKPMIDWFVQWLEPKIRWVMEKILSVMTSVFGNIFESIKGIIGNMKGIFMGLITFLEGVFTGDWRKIFNGLLTIAKNIGGAIGNVLKAPINTMVDGLNAFIGGINKIKIPSWVPGVGGKGINIPRVPRLQRGTIINRPQFIAGDGGAEAVIPLENDTRALEMIAQMLAERGALGGDGTIQNDIQIDGETLFRVLTKIAKKQQMQSNGGVALGF